MALFRRRVARIPGRFEWCGNWGGGLRGERVFGISFLIGVNNKRTKSLLELAESLLVDTCVISKNSIGGIDLLTASCRSSEFIFFNKTRGCFNSVP